MRIIVAFSLFMIFQIEGKCQINIDWEAPDSIVAEKLKNKKYYMFGEIHGTRSSYDLAFEMMKYLNKAEGLKVLLIERSPLYIFYVNRFMKTGNKRVLDSLINTVEATLIWTKDELKFYKKIRRYNEKIPRENRITIQGIVGYKDIHVTLKYLVELAGRRKKECQKILVNTDFEMCYASKFEDFYDMFLRQDSVVQKRDSDLKDIYGERYNEFKAVYTKLKDEYALANKSMSAFYDRRDTLMADNIYRIQHEEEKPVFVFIGLNHVLRNDQYSVVDILNQHHLVANDLMVSIATVLHKSKITEMINDSTRRKYYTIESTKYVRGYYIELNENQEDIDGDFNYLADADINCRLLLAGECVQDEAPFDMLFILNRSKHVRPIKHRKAVKLNIWFFITRFIFHPSEFDMID